MENSWLDSEQTRRVVAGRFEVELNRKLDNEEMPAIEACRRMMQHVGVEANDKTLTNWQTAMNGWRKRSRLPEDLVHMQALAWFLDADPTAFATMLGAQRIEMARRGFGSQASTKRTSTVKGSNASS